MSLARDDGHRVRPVRVGKDRSVAELERDLDRIRAEMDRTIDLIEHRLSPNRLIEQALAHMRGGPGVFAANLDRTVRRHSVLTAMLAAGIGGRLLAEKGDKAEPPASQRHRSPMSAHPSHPREALGSVPPTGSDRLSVAPHPPGAHSEEGKAMSHSRRDGWNLFDRRGSQGRFGGNVENARGKLGQVGSAAKAQVDRARTGFEQMLKEQPLVLGAVAMALGAVLGAVLPTTRLEKRYLGSTREQLKHRAGSYAREQWEKAEDVALSAAAMDRAEREGVAPSSIYEQATDKVARAVEVAAGAAQHEETRQNLGGT